MCGRSSGPRVGLKKTISQVIRRVCYVHVSTSSAAGHQNKMLVAYNSTDTLNVLLHPDYVYISRLSCQEEDGLEAA